VTTMGRALMIAFELLVGYKMHGGVIGLEIVWHRHDLFTNTILLGVIGNDIYNTFVRRRLRKVLTVTGTCLINRRLSRNRVLHAALHACDLTDGVRVALR